MAIQTATAGNLENIQNIVIGAMRYAAESAAPCKNLVEKITLGSGEKTVTIPKVGAISFDKLTDGIDITDSKDLSISTTDLTTGEAGGKFIITDKLSRQSTTDPFKMVGRLAGDAAARLVDRDIIALFTALNAGTKLGLDNKSLTFTNAMACVAYSQAQMYPGPVNCVHHPNAIYAMTASAAAIGMTYYAGILGSQSEALLRNFWKANFAGVNFFWDANIDKEASVDSGIGAIFSKNAMCYIESAGWKTERERDASLRATEIVTTSDYGVFELDDAYGAGMQYEIGTVSTAA